MAECEILFQALAKLRRGVNLRKLQCPSQKFHAISINTRFEQNGQWRHRFCVLMGIRGQGHYLRCSDYFYFRI